VHKDTLAIIGFSVWLFGWAAIWPVARWGFHRTPSECRVLLWIFLATLVLEAASLFYIWDLHRAGNRDWFMAWLLPQAIATISWIASLIALAVAVLGGASTSGRGA